MKRKFLSLMTACLFCLAGMLTAIDFPTLSQAPAVDGSGEDLAWKNIPWNGGFVTVGANTKPDAETAFKAGVSGDFLYFLIKAEEPDTALLKQKCTTRDALVFTDDSIEVIVDAENAGENLTHIIVNTLGTIYDSTYSQGGLVANSNWNFQHARTAVLIEKNYFQVELALPLAELGFHKGDGKIRFNVARQRYGKMREVSSFSPAKGSLQVPATMTDGTIRAPGMEAYAYRLSAPFDLAVSENGEKLTGKIQLSNQTGKIRFLEIRVNDQPGIRRVINANLSSEISFSLPYSPKINLQVEVREKGALRLCNVFLVEKSYQPIRIQLSSPAYRDNIYSDEQIQSIEGSVSFHASNSNGVRPALVLLDASGRSVAAGTPEANGSFSLATGTLPEGSYTLIAKYGQLECRKTIRKLPKHPGEVRITQQGVLLVDGKPFTPYGWFRLNLKDGARDGYNLSFYYNAPWQTDDELRDYLDQAQALGLKVVTYCYPRGNSMMTNSAYRKSLNDEEAKAIADRVSKFSSHPALLAWYLADEPEYEPWLRARLEKVYEICREADPWHPAVIVNNSVAGLLKYQGIGDISVPDYYTGFLEKGNSATPIGRYGELLAASRKLDSRAQWGIPQGFTWEAYGSKGHRVPDYDEMRNMHYQTLVNGHTGVVWYSHELNYTYPSVHIHAKKLRDEMVLFHELWENPRLRREIAMTPKLAAASYHDLDGQDYVIAVNLTPDDLPIDLPAPSNRLFLVAGEPGVSLTPRQGRITDRLKRYRTRVYTTDARKAAAFAARPEQEKVLAAEKALARPGNLAYYRTSGVQVTCSRLNDSRIPRHLVCDGAYSSLFVFDKANDPRCEVTLTFPKPVKVSRLELHGRQIRNFTVSTPGGKMGEFHGNGTSFARIQADTATETNQITVADFDGFGISEIEVYSDPAKTAQEEVLE